MNRGSDVRVVLVGLSFGLVSCSAGGSDAAAAEAKLEGRLLEIVKADTREEPVEELGRKLLLAHERAVRGDAEGARTLLDEVAGPIAEMPRTGDDEKSINFPRMGLRGRWIRAMAVIDPAAALASALEYGDETNPMYHASLLGGLIDDLDCSDPVLREAALGNVRRLLQTGGQGVSQKTMGAIHAPPAVETAARLARRCGLPELAREAVELAKDTRKLYLDTTLRFRACSAVTAQADARFAQDPQKALEDFGKFRLKPQNDYEKEDACGSERLSFLAGLERREEIGSELAASADAFLLSAIDDLSDRDYEYACGLSTSLEQLADRSPAAVARAGRRVLDTWKQKGVSSYCDTLAELSEVALALEAAGQAPDWMCGLASAEPGGELTEEQSSKLRRDRQLAAASLAGSCPAEAAPVLAAMGSADAADLARVRARQLRVDHAGAEALAEADVEALPEAERYAYAAALLPVLLEPPAR